MLRKTLGDWWYWWSNGNQADQDFYIPAVAYRPQSAEHQLLIEKQIKKLEQAYSDLIWSIPSAAKNSAMEHANKDTAIMLGAGVCGYYVFDLLTSNIPLLGSSIKTAEYMVAIYGLYHLAQKMRAEQKSVFDLELDRLTSLFDWCSKNGAEVSHDETFIKLAGALSPYCRTEKLMLWPSDEISRQYKVLMTLPPHNQVFQDVKPPRYSGVSFFGYHLPEQYSPLSASTIEAGSRIIADLKRWGYGPA